MADELDPLLEARLREALRAEADALPQLVRVHDLERERNRRRARRLAMPGSVLAAAAVIALLVGTGVIPPGDVGGGAGSSSPSASTQPPLASYEELTALLSPGSSLLLRSERAEAGTNGETVSVDLGNAGPAGALGLALHCLGGAVDIELDTGAEDSGTIHTECALKPLTSVLPGVSRPARVTLTASDRVRWRVVITGAEPPPTLAARASLSPGTVELRLAVQVLEQCGSEGGCAYYAELEDEHGAVTTLELDTGASVDLRPAPGRYELTFRSAVVSDIIVKGSPPGESADAACRAGIVVDRVGTGIVATAVFRADTCEIRSSASSAAP